MIKHGKDLGFSWQFVYTTCSTLLTLLCMVDFIWIWSYFYPKRTFSVSRPGTQSYYVIEVFRKRKKS